MKRERVEAADTNVTYRLTAGMAKHIAVVARDRDLTQSRYIADLIEQDGREENLEISQLRSLLKEVSRVGNFRINSVLADILDDLLADVRATCEIKKLDKATLCSQIKAVAQGPLFSMLLDDQDVELLASEICKLFEIER